MHILSKIFFGLCTLIIAFMLLLVFSVLVRVFFVLVIAVVFGGIPMLFEGIISNPWLAVSFAIAAFCVWLYMRGDQPSFTSLLRRGRNIAKLIPQRLRRTKKSSSRSPAPKPVERVRPKFDFKSSNRKRGE